MNQEPSDYQSSEQCRSRITEIAESFIAGKISNRQYFQEIDKMFCIVCFHGWLSLAKTVFQQYPNINISAYDNYAFRLSCKNGHLEIAKWLLQIKPTIDISACNEFAFNNACFEEHLEIAQWLLSIKPTINVSLWNDDLFCSLCGNGKTKIAKWLFEMRPSIRVDARGHYPIISACLYGHIETLKWLRTVDITYNITLYNDMIFRNVCRQHLYPMAVYLSEDWMPHRYKISKIYRNISGEIIDFEYIIFA